MSTPLDWENRPQQFPEPVTQDVADELLSVMTAMTRAFNQYVEDVTEEDLAAQRAETERVLKTWGVQ